MPVGQKYFRGALVRGVIQSAMYSLAMARDFLLVGRQSSIKLKILVICRILCIYLGYKDLVELSPSFL